MANQEGTGSAGPANTSVHNIQEPPRCPHRDPTEPIQEKGQNGPIGPPRIPCHPGRHRPLDPGTSTTSAIGERPSHDWEKVNFTQMVTGHNNGLLDYLEHKDSIAHLQDFLDVVLPNLHQHYICRSTDCSFVIKASHWINSATPDKQGKYLRARCRTEYRPWAAAAVNNPNKRFCPAAQCLVTKVTSATPPDSDGWAQQLTNHTTSTDTFYLYLMKFPTTNDQKLLNDCKLAVDQVATALSQSPDPQAALLEYINTVLTHAQMLPYFQQHVVSQDILNQVQQANAMRTKNNHSGNGNIFPSPRIPTPG